MEIGGESPVVFEMCVAHCRQPLGGNRDVVTGDLV
jgi:hypothetical protein